MKESNKGFFAVDQRSWAKVCDLNNINVAIAYLVMASGTGFDNCTTAWSVNAIEKYTSISRHRAKEAVQILISNGLVRKRKKGSGYEIIPFAKIGIKGRPKKDKPQLVWLPNTIITGAVNETPPIELIRQSQKLPALRLFVDMYGSHYLATHGGIDRNFLWSDSKKVRVGEYGPYIIFGFDLNDASSHVSAKAPFVAPFLTGKQKDGWQAFWAALDILRLTGLVEVVHDLLDDAGESAEIMHPYALFGAGEPLEQEITRIANLAAERMLNDRYTIPLVPVLRHLADVTLVSIFRLRYKPHTKMSAAWIMSQSEWQTWAEKYRDLAGERGVSAGEYSRKLA